MRPACVLTESCIRLLVIVLLSVVHDVEEAELVNALGGGDDTEPVTELLLLEELLGTTTKYMSVSSYSNVLLIHTKLTGPNSQVLQVATRELLVSNNLNLLTTDLGDGDVVAKVTSAALDLDALVQELLKGGNVEDLVVDGLRSVDDELLGDLLTLLGLGSLLHVHNIC